MKDGEHPCCGESPVNVLSISNFCILFDGSSLWGGAGDLDFYWVRFLNLHIEPAVPTKVLCTNNKRIEFVV